MKKYISMVASALLLVSASLAQAFPIASTGDGLSVVVSGNDDVIATYQGNSASYSNDLYLVNTGEFIFNNHSSAVGSTVNLGSFAIGTELVFKLFVNNTNTAYFTGSGAANPDSQAHARVQEEWNPGETLVSFEDLFNGPFDFNDLSFSFTNTDTSTPIKVPEPAPFTLFVIGLISLLWFRKKMAK